MKKTALSLAIACSAMGAAAWAQAPVPVQSPYAAETKAANDRYQGDLKLCNDEKSSDARLQCRRDARSVYDRAMSDAKARKESAAPQAATVKAPAQCADCAIVIEVAQHEKAGEGGAVGMIAGGVGGALLGRQVGSGSGRDLATIAGAVGGAYAGKKIEEKVKTHKVWSVGVQYANGSKKTFEFDKDPAYRIGDAVRESGGTLVRP